MQIITTAIFPIFCIILFGFVLRKKFYRVQKFWDILDSLTYYILMPSMLFYKIASAEINNSKELFSAFFIVLVGFLIVVFLSIILNFVFKFEAPKFTSFFQGSIRYNTYIFLAIVSSCYGEQGVLVAAYIMAFMIPIINVFCVAIFAIYIKQGNFSIYKTFKSIIKNPLILACLLGIFANLLNTKIIIFEPLRLIGTAAITTGLLSVGAGLKFGEIKNLNLEFYLSLILKLLIYPLLVFILSKTFNLNKELSSVAIFFASMPTATSSYILAGQMGGDKKLMSIIITLQTIISMFSIWVIYFFIN